MSWDCYVQQTVSSLQDALLLRRLHVLHPTSVPTVAYIDAAQMDGWLQELGQLDSQARRVRQSMAVKQSHVPETQTTTDRHRLCLFSLNDYLGLSAHPDVCRAMAQAATTYGLGPRSSALVGGFTASHRQLETAMAQLKGMLCGASQQQHCSHNRY